MIAAISIFVASPPAACKVAQHVLGAQRADDILRMIAPERQPRMRRRQHRLARSPPAARSTLIVVISVRWIITSETSSSRRSRMPPTMSRSSFSTLPCACMRSTAPRNSSCGDRIGWFSPTFIPKHRSTQRANASIAISIGPNNPTTNCIGRATRSAPRSGALKAAVFGMISVKTTTTIVMIDGGVDDADIAEPRQQNAGGERGRGDIHRIVAEQDRAEQALARGQQPVDDLRAAIAVLFQPRHRRARRRGQRGLACGKERGQQQDRRRRCRARSSLPVS